MRLYSLENRFVRVALAADGSLAELVCRATGTHYIARPQRDLWRIILQDDESLVNLVTPAGQKVEVGSDGRQLRLTVPRLTYAAHDGPRTVAVTLRLAVTLDGDASFWVAEIENREPHVRVMEVWAPMINGLQPPADWALYYPQDCGMRLPDPVHNLGERGKVFRFGVGNVFQRELYPGKASMQWMGVYGAREGLYVASRDKSLRTICLNAERNVEEKPAEDSLLLCFIRYPGQREGTWTAAPVEVAPQVGDWRAGARRYRAWADTWIRPSTPPDWVQRLTGLQDTILREQYGKVVYTYDDLPTLQSSAAEAGLDLVKLTGWHPAGHDNGYPDYWPDPALGGAERLRQQIARAQADGGRVMLYLQAVQMTRNSTFYAAQGEAVAQRDPYGNVLADTFTWPGDSTFLPLAGQHRLVNACLACLEWQNILQQRTREAAELGADCVYLDRLAGFPGYLCFNEGHPHAGPDASFADRVRLGFACRDLVNAVNPQAALASEYLNDAGLQPFDFTIPFGFGVHHGGANFGELFRYTFPEYVITTQYLNGPESDRLRYAFVMGLRFFFAIRWQHDPLSATPPAFRAEVRRLVDLWRAHADPFLTGRFTDTDGLRIGNPALFAKSYRSAARCGAVVWNPTDGVQPLDVTAESGDRLAWQGPEGRVGETLLPRSLAVAVAPAP